MKRDTGENSLIQNKSQEALLNEYKGNVFEYLVCIELSKKFKNEIAFLRSIPIDILNILEQQESMLRNFYEHLLIELPKLAEITAKSIIDDLKIKKIDRVILVGKKLASSKNTDFNESDILIYTTKQKYHAISLKISRLGSFVNTKSAGVRTVLKRYFEHDIAESLQEKLNEFVDYEYESLAMKMHDEADIFYTKLFENWERSGLPVLPGQLDDSSHRLLMNYYYILNKKICENFQKLYNYSEKLFYDSLFSLMGFSSKNITQVTSFYSQSDSVFNKMKVEVLNFDNVKLLHDENIKFKLNKSNFEIDFAGHVIQVRVKPMNKFTSKAFKVNCAVKKIN